MRSVAIASFLLAAAVFGNVLAHDDVYAVEGALGWTAVEMRDGHDRALAMAPIRQLAEINAGLTDLARRDAGACRWMNQVTGPETLARQVGAFDAYPAIKAVIQAARMTVRDYLLTLHAISETALTVHAIEQQIEVDAAASAGNVAFYSKHRGEIEELLDAPDPC